MPTLTKFNCFVGDIGTKIHNLNADALKVLLTNIAPVVTNSVKADLTEISSGNGYTAGGLPMASTAYSQTGGVAKLTGNAVTVTASGGAIAGFRYAVLYNSTPAAGNLIGFWDNGSTITLNDGESEKIAADVTGGNWTSSLPILTIA